MTRVLITGGLGFIGSHLAHTLTDHNHEVLAYGTIQHYHSPGPTFLENINYRLSHLLSQSQIVRGSTLEPLTLNAAIRQFSPTHIVHLAALPIASTAMRHTSEAFTNILHGLFNVLELLKDTGIRLTYASSSMVYGDFTESPMPEDGSTHPKEMYGTLKLMGELLVRTYSQRFHVPSVIIRPSAVYGPSDINYRVLQIFIENAVQGKPLRINSNACLDFTYVTDTADGIEKATLSPYAVDKTLNITRGEGRTLTEAVAILKTHFPDLKVIKGEEPSYTPKRGALDISRAWNLLDYHPSFSLEEGLEAYIAYVNLHNRSLHGCHCCLGKG